jgi:NAD(P)-dependent dehydrogenase (short-subunit alcohol dehydrogenase family)
MSKQSLKGKVALVTGGGKNLGGLVSLTLAAEGARIAVHYHSPASKAAAEETVASINALGGHGIVLDGDLSQEAEVQLAFSETIRCFGKVDIVVNTAGQILKKLIVDTTVAEYDSLAAVNAKAAFLLIREAGRRLNKNGRFVTIVTSLLAGYTGYYSTYAGGKASVEQFIRAASKEFADQGITVNAVAPGPMDTPFFHAQETPDSVAWLKSQGMGNRLTEIEDIAQIVKFLVADNNWITGQTIFANGGFATR